MAKRTTQEGKPYYGLFVRRDGTWTYEFGAYDKIDVDNEAWDQREHGVRKADLKTHTFANGPQVGGQTITDLLREMNTPPQNTLPPELFTIGYRGSTVLGSYTSVSHGEKFYNSREACQAAIDATPGWLGGDRERLCVIPLVRG